MSDSSPTAEQPDYVTPPQRVEKHDVPFRTDAEVRELVEQFEQCRWPYERWTHRAHIAVAVSYLRTLPLEEAIKRMRRNIQRYNASSGGEPNGYHETITIFFLRLIAGYLRTHADGRAVAEIVNALCAGRASKASPFAYYSADRLSSAEARAGWVEPDLQSLEANGMRAPSEGAFVIESVSPHCAEATALLAELMPELDRRYPEYEGGGVGDITPADVCVFLIGRLDGKPVACGALRPMEEPGVAEVKRMYVEPAARGRGLSKRMLAALEEHAQQVGFACVRLETGMRQPEALRLYESAGYRRIENYPPYVGNAMSVCFEKRFG
jgi:GNAT superfamily N-acetyltransferase